MDNITFSTIDGLEYVLIDHGNNKFTSMLKESYDRMINEPSIFEGLIN